MREENWFFDEHSLTLHGYVFISESHVGKRKCPRSTHSLTAAAYNVEKSTAKRGQQRGRTSKTKCQQLLLLFVLSVLIFCAWER